VVLADEGVEDIGEVDIGVLISGVHAAVLPFKKSWVVEVDPQLMGIVFAYSKTNYSLLGTPVFFNLGSAEPLGSAKILSGSAKCLNFFWSCICIIEITFTIDQPTPFSLKSAYELNTVL
jgi:hypothetical protein